MWGKKEKQITFEEKINIFSEIHCNILESSIVKIENVEFSFSYSGFERDTKIYLTDGIDKLLVYKQKAKESKWLHKGAWCQVIEQIVQKQLDLETQRTEAIDKKKLDEENRVKDKFEKLFEGNSHG